MSFRCTSSRTLQFRTLQLAEEALPCGYEGFDATPDEVFQCELEGNDHEFHGAYLDELASPDKDAYFCWSSKDDTQYVIASEPCLAKSDAENTCFLFQNHPGRCSWEIVDPKDIALTAGMDQILAYIRDHGDLPPQEWMSKS